MERKEEMEMGTLMEKFDDALIYMTCAKEFAKNKFREKFIKDESGMEVITIIIIIAVVLVIGFMFRDYITSFVKDLWKNNVEKVGQENNVNYVPDPQRPGQG